MNLVDEYEEKGYSVFRLSWGIDLKGAQVVIAESRGTKKLPSAVAQSTTHYRMPGIVSTIWRFAKKFDMDMVEAAFNMDGYRKIKVYTAYDRYGRRVIVRLFAKQTRGGN